MALIKNETGEVVQKLSKHYRFSGPADEVSETKKQDVLFFRETTLPAGRYTVDVAAYDAATTKTAVESASVLAMNPAPDRLRLSSVVLVKRTETLSEAEKKASNPFHYQDALLYPNLGEPVKKAAGNLSIFFDVYPGKASPLPPRLLVEVFSNGQPGITLRGKLPSPDATGRIQYAAAVPLDKVPAGRCALRVSVGDGRDTISRTVNFDLSQ